MKKRKLLMFWNMIIKVPTMVVVTTLTTTHDQHKEIGKFSTFNIQPFKF